MKRISSIKNKKVKLFLGITFLYILLMGYTFQFEGRNTSFLRFLFILVYIILALAFYQTLIHQKEITTLKESFTHLMNPNNKNDVPLQIYEDTSVLYYDFKYMFPPYKTYGMRKITHAIKSFEVFVRLALSKDDKIIMYGESIYLIYIPHTKTSQAKSRIEQQIDTFNKNNDICPLSFEYHYLDSSKEISSLLKNLKA